MATNPLRDSDTSLWLHNKLGTSNDSWISGSICSQLNKEVLRNIKECFPDLQTQVKLKLLLNFFHIPRRLVEEWKTELEEVIEVAGLDSELWVSMLAETMKTFPATSSLNTEIADYDETRPIFTDMVSDLRKFVNKHSDLGMLPLECLYLNKNALVSVVGQQPAPVKHFTLKRKPKSAALRTELLHKSADAQSSLKKVSAPTIPLRSRGMPRKMTDTTPLKGIPSRMPTTGFRSPTVPVSQQRPNLSRTPAGRKDGGIKLIEMSEQPLGYAAAKKRKREQQLEEQQKKQEQKQQAAAAAAAAAASTSANTGDSSPTTNQTNAGSTSVGETPTTPTSANNSYEIKTESQLNQSVGGLDESNNEEFKTPEVATKTNKGEPSTPEYAATLTYTQSTPTSAQNSTPESKGAAIKSTIVTTPKSSTAHSKVNNNNTYNHATKRIKQEIEIKSEEIIVPANIKLEKIDNSMQTTLIQTIPAQQPQRVIIQQQQPILIRTSAAQKQKLKSQATATTTTIGGTTIKMEKLDIKPMVRVASTATSTATTPTATLLTSQQLRQAATNSLVNLPNNISVKITSSKVTRAASGASTSAQAQHQLQLSQQSQKQQPILINSSTPIILASTPTTSHAMRTKPIITSTTTTIPTHTIKSMPISQIKSATNSGPVIISQTIIQPTKRLTQQGASTSAAAAAAAVHSNGPSTSAAAAAAAAAQAAAQKQQQHQQQVQIQQQQPQQTIITTHQLTQGLPQQQPQTTQYIITTPQSQQQHQSNTVTLPTLTSFSQTRSIAQTPTLYQTAPSTSAAVVTNTPTKILLKNSSVVMTPVRQQQQQQATATIVTSNNPPPLVATSAAGVAVAGVDASLLNIQNVQLPNRPVTIQPASQAAQQQHIQAQLQQQQQHPHPQHTIVANTTATQQPKLSQVIMQPAAATNVVPAPSSATAATAVTPLQTNVSQVANKTKTILVTPKGAQVILRNIGGDVYQQIPISNVNNLQGLTTATQGATLMTSTAAGPPGLVKTTSTVTNMQPQTIKIQQQPTQPLPTLIPTNTGQHIIVQQQTPTNVIGPTPQTIIRPVMTTLPQGLTLIQRPGGIQQQIVQVPGQQRTIITQPALQGRPQQIVLQHKSGQQRIITTTNTNAGAQTTTQTQQIQIQQQANQPGISRTVQLQVQQPQQPQQQQPQQNAQQQQQQQQAPQRKGLSLSNEHVHKAHEMFRKANRVSRPDKALILGFMAGLRENPRPNSDNVLIIKLGESEEKVQQEDGNTALCLVESHIRLDYNTGEWKTFQNYRLLDQSAAS